MFQAERIKDEFDGTPDIHKYFKDSIIESYRQDARSESSSPDPADIKVDIELSHNQAKLIRERYSNYLDSPTDSQIYRVIDKAIKGDEERKTQ